MEIHTGWHSGSKSEQTKLEERMGEASIRAKRSGGKPDVPKRKTEGTWDQRVLVRSGFLWPPGIGPPLSRPLLQLQTKSWAEFRRLERWYTKRVVSQKITEGQLDLREDKESWALEGRLLHLLAACLGLPVFCLWPWAGCQGTEPCLRHMKP